MLSHYCPLAKPFPLTLPLAHRSCNHTWCENHIQRAHHFPGERVGEGGVTRTGEGTVGVLQGSLVDPQPLSVEQNGNGTSGYGIPLLIGSYPVVPGVRTGVMQTILEKEGEDSV